MFQSLRDRGYEVEFQSHARAIIKEDFPEAVEELESALSSFSIPVREIIGSGGGEAAGTQRLRRSLSDLGWRKFTFDIKKSINGLERESISHEIDHVRTFEREGFPDRIALEIEWNNKDPFFDRDLENFKRLHADGAISVGIIITRGATLQSSIREAVLRYVTERNVSGFEDLLEFGVEPTRRQRNAVEGRLRRIPEAAFRSVWADIFVSDKFGRATTHWDKLHDRVQRGVGNPCPLLLIGLPATILTYD